MRTSGMGLRTAVTVTTTIACVAMTGCAKVGGVYTYEARGAAAQGPPPFDAQTYVDSIWASKVLPTVVAKAVDVSVLAAAIKADPAAAGRRYGRQSGTGSPYAYLTKGVGTVLKVDRSAPTGPVTVRIGPAAAKLTVTIATGPVLPGTALRDGVGFITFGQFANQIQYADVGTQLNRKVKTDVLPKLDLSRLVGRRLSFTGAFSLLVPSSIFIVPTSVSVSG